MSIHKPCANNIVSLPDELEVLDTELASKPDSPCQYLKYRPR